MHATHSVPAGAHPHHRTGLAVFAAAIALSAWGGAAGLIIGFLALDPVAESRLPFQSPVLGGVALAAIVAVPMTGLAVLAWRDDPRAGEAALVCGVLQIGWIIGELLFIRELSFFHPIYLVIGAVLVFIGLRSPRT